MRRWRIVLAAALFCPLVPETALAAEAGQVNPFFAFDNGTGRGQLPPEVQAKMLAELGYDGIGYTGTKGIPEMLAALDRHGLKMFSTYVGATVGPDGPAYDPGLKDAIEALRGRQTILWLTIRGRADNGEEQAVQVVSEIGALAEKAGLRVALYPHVGFFVARVEDAVRITKKVDRKNVGASFNLCHWLKLDSPENLEPLLKQACPYLFLASINGADREGGWDRLIQTLDRGEYDVGAFLHKLRAHGYRGPVGLQCYQVKGDIRKNLQRSIEAWRRLSRISHQ